MDTCAKKCSITFKTLRYIMSGSDNFLGCILCTPTLHFWFIIVLEYRSHKCICVGVRYYRWPSCKLPCFLLLLTPAIPNDASSPPVHSKPRQTMPGKSVLQNVLWFCETHLGPEDSPSTLQSLSWKTHIDTRGSTWLWKGGCCLQTRPLWI